MLRSRKRKGITVTLGRETVIAFPLPGEHKFRPAFIIYVLTSFCFDIAHG